MTKFYNLPPSWNPGYADPEYVQDEGLQRRAFVTRMSPRGTYDDPKVGAGGYALPNYIGKEGYGQGTYVTKMTKRGTYNGPAVPNYLDRQPKVIGERAIGKGAAIVSFALSGIDPQDVASTNMYAKFGARAAARIIAHVMRMPPQQRRAAMKAALNAMDPSLFGKAERYSNELVTSGVPVQVALARGLARAITEGMLLELERSGRTGTLPQAKSLPGLGCYRERGSLGALGAIERITTTNTTMTPTGTCAPPAGYTWDVSTGQPFLRRIKVGEVPREGPCGGSVSQSSPTTEIGTGPAREGEMLEVGPSSSRVWFKIPVQGGRLRFTQLTRAQLDAKHVTASQREMLGSSLTADAWADIQAQVIGMSKLADKLKAFMDVSMIDGTSMGIPAQIADVVVNGKFPLYNFQWPAEGPIKGRRVGLYIRFTGSSSLPQWEMQYRINEPSDPIGAAFSWIKGLFARIVNVVKDVVEEIGDMACNLVNNPAAPAAAASAASSSPQGAAAAAGVAIAASACSKGLPPSAAPTVIGGMDMNTVVLLGAGALVVVALAKRKRKTP